MNNIDIRPNEEFGIYRFINEIEKFIISPDISVVETTFKNPPILSLVNLKIPIIAIGKVIILELKVAITTPLMPYFIIRGYVDTAIKKRRIRFK